MNLREYTRQLASFIEAHPESLDMVVITSIDDEGNGFNNVLEGPSMGIYEDMEFTYHADLEELGRNDDEMNAVCLN